jgi:hypothetical protein
MSSPEQVTSLPGFEGRRLPIDTAIMPTAMTWLADGRLAFTSLRGQVWIADDQDKDGSPDALTLFAEGLAAPMESRQMAVPFWYRTSRRSCVCATRIRTVEQMSLMCLPLAGDSATTITTGPRHWLAIRMATISLGLGSDYSQNNRPADNDRWRGPF